MRRKNKNIILITILLMFASFSIILYSELRSDNLDNNTNYSDTINDYDANYGYYPGYNYGNNNQTTTSDVKITRSSQIITTVIASILVFISIQILFYLLFSGFNYLTFKLTFFPLAKLGVYLILSLGLTISILYFTIKPITFLPADIEIKEDSPNENQNSKDTPNLEGKEITQKDINLDDYKENISITRGGTYNLTGKFTKSIIIDCNGDVTLTLNNVEITTQDMASIINKGNGKLKIETLENTINTLGSDGNSYYDSVIYSTGPLELKGKGTLKINDSKNIGINVSSNDFTMTSGNVIISAKNYGIITSEDGGLINIIDGNLIVNSTKANLKSKQNIIIDGGITYLYGTEEDSPIDTVNGYEINGGTLVALGKDIYETPLKSSKNYTICLKLQDIVSKDSIVDLKNSKKDILTFTSADDFNSLIISSPSINKDTYNLYKDGKSNGNLNNYIYQDGSYTDGNLAFQNIEVTSKITAKK